VRKDSDCHPPLQPIARPYSGFAPRRAPTAENRLKCPTQPLIHTTYSGSQPRIPGPPAARIPAGIEGAGQETPRVSRPSYSRGWGGVHPIQSAKTKKKKPKRREASCLFSRSLRGLKCGYSLRQS